MTIVMLVVVIEVVTVEKKAACLEEANWGGTL